MPSRSLLAVLAISHCLACAAEDVRRRIIPNPDAGGPGPETPAPDGPAFPAA